MDENHDPNFNKVKIMIAKYTPEYPNLLFKPDNYFDVHLRVGVDVNFIYYNFTLKKEDKVTFNDNTVIMTDYVFTRVGFSVPRDTVHIVERICECQDNKTAKEIAYLINCAISN
jgi:hypothetical protein